MCLNILGAAKNKRRILNKKKYNFHFSNVMRKPYAKTKTFSSCLRITLIVCIDKMFYMCLDNASYSNVT